MRIALIPMWSTEIFELFRGQVVLLVYTQDENYEENEESSIGR